MTLLRKLSVVALMLAMLVAMPKIPQARVMMTSTVNGFYMDITPTAQFTTDDWINTPEMFTLYIVNAGPRTVKYAYVDIDISHGGYGTVLTGKLTVIGPRAPTKAFKTELLPGDQFVIENTMIGETTGQMSGGSFEDTFQDEVLRIGALPEGTYKMKFKLRGYYETAEDEIDEWELEHTMEIKNPTPPELITPDEGSDDTVTNPHFAWQRPLVSDFSGVNAQRVIEISYNFKVWKMFGDDGSVLNEEDAINRIPIWDVENLTLESLDFDSGSANEELVAGRKYCWQVQAVDGLGRPISSLNDGKSDVWDFTCQFSPPTIIEPLSLNPFGFSWTAARAGGGMMYYRVRIADNADFAGGYEEDGLLMTSFRYPQDAPPLNLGETYFLELQATDDSGIPIGEPATTSFSLTIEEVTLSSPPDGAIPSSSNPTFSWQGNSPFYIVTISDEQTEWSYVSGAVEDVTWTYDGDDLIPGKTYAWNVAPSNDMGDPIGDSSETWYITLAAAGQATLVSPIGEDVDSLTPMLTWSAFEGTGQIEYTLIVEDSNGTMIHSATVTSTSYQYPQDATELEYAAIYSWSVNAEQNNTEVGTRSEKATFTTPLAEAGSTVATMEEIGNMVKVVLDRFPQFAAYQDKVLVSISDETGPLTPSSFLELFDTFKIVKVTEQ